MTTIFYTKPDEQNGKHYWLKYTETDLGIHTGYIENILFNVLGNELYLKKEAFLRYELVSTDNIDGRNDTWKVTLCEHVTS